MELVAHFDHSPVRAKANPIVAQSGSEVKVYAKTQSLHHEHTADVCALLVTYLSSLPDALIHRSLGDALWAWSVSPSVIRQEKRLRRRGDDDASESEYETSEDEDENAPSYNARLRQMELEQMNLPPLKVQLLLAQHVLLLLPPRHFSLVVHLLTFFATLLVCPENGLGADDIGRIFGATIVGGKTRKRGRREAARDMERCGGNRDEKEQKTLVWLVNHWERISSAYEYEGEPSGRSSGRPQAGRTRTRSFGDDTAWMRRRSSPSRYSRIDASSSPWRATM